MFEGIFGKKRTEVNEEAAYHITITNKKTGKVEYDADTNAILGAFDTGDHARGVCMTAADATTCAAVLGSARKVINNFVETHPELDILLHIISKKNRTEPADESEDTAE